MKNKHLQQHLAVSLLFAQFSSFKTKISNFLSQNVIPLVVKIAFKKFLSTFLVSIMSGDGCDMTENFFKKLV